MVKKIRKMGIMIFVAVMLFTNCCFASSVGESQLAVGTENLIKDLTNWLLILAPVLTACLIGYYLLRKSASPSLVFFYILIRLKTLKYRSFILSNFFLFLVDVCCLV